MAPNTYLDRLRSRLRDFTREHGVLGALHPDRLFEELNDLECLIAHETRRQERRAVQRSFWARWVPVVSTWGMAA